METPNELATKLLDGADKIHGGFEAQSRRMRRAAAMLRAMAAEMTFNRLREANLARVSSFGHGGIQGGWTETQWSNALNGEAGELAEAVLALAVSKATGVLANTIKKYDRQAFSDATPDELVVQIAEELGDVVIYCDLLAAKLDLDLGHVARLKFNATSDKHGLPHRIE